MLKKFISFITLSTITVVCLTGCGCSKRNIVDNASKPTESVTAEPTAIPLDRKTELSDTEQDTKSIIDDVSEKLGFVPDPALASDETISTTWRAVTAANSKDMVDKELEEFALEDFEFVLDNGSYTVKITPDGYSSPITREGEYKIIDNFVTFNGECEGSLAYINAQDENQLIFTLAQGDRFVVIRMER